MSRNIVEIIVCIKQVPDTSEVKIDKQTNTLIREGVPSIINPFDMNAIEEAIRLKEKHGGKVTVLTMGPPQAESALREAISLGADDAVLVSDRQFAGSDTLATAYTLSSAIKKIGKFDIILCGKQAIDGDTGQVGPGIAEVLGLPDVAFARKIEVTDGAVRVERLLEDGYEILEMKIPCLVTVTNQINTPRVPSIRGKMMAKKAEIKKLNLQDINLDPARTGLAGSPTCVVKIFSPPLRSGGEIFTGEIEGTTDKLITKIKELGLV